MTRRKVHFSAVFLTIWIFLPCALWPQAAQPPVPISVNELDYLQKHIEVWPVIGKVTNLKGEPVGGAKVVVDIGGGEDSVRVVETDLQGDFHTAYTLDAKRHPALQVKLSATKPGFLEAREWVHLDSGDMGPGTHLVLREQVEDPELLSLSNLISALAPRLRDDSGLASMPGSTRKDFVRGSEELFDRNDPGAAVTHLEKVAKHEPDCSPCRTLFGLALLATGSWEGAQRELAAAGFRPRDKAGTRRAEPFLVLGVIETWRWQVKKSEGYFRQALDADPANPLALQELGRVLIFQKNWEAANDALQKAIKAGAAADAHLLRTRALMAEGENEEAQAEMNAYIAGRKTRDLPVAVRMVFWELQDRLEIAAYSEAKSVVDETPKELVGKVPELMGLEPARSQDELAPILEKVGKSVEAFFRNFPNTISNEEIREESLRQDGKVAELFEEEFQYLLLARPEKWGLGLNEYRTHTQAASAAPNRRHEGFMRTAGFASASIIFHPAYQEGVSFRYLGRQESGGRPASVVAFAQRPDKAVVLERFDVNKTSVPVLLQGLAWIDPSTFQISRMRSDLLKPPPKVRLERQTTEIQFAEVRFKEIPRALWLPREVEVTVQWKGRVFRNLHRYSDFKLFNVEAEEKRKAVEVLPQGPQTPR